LSDNCRNCGAANLTQLFNAPGFDNSPKIADLNFDLAICDQCAITSTLDPQQHIENAYTEEYYGTPNNKFLAVIENSVSAAANSRAKHLLKLWHGAKQQSHQVSVLDIGCGRGVLLRAFKSQGARILGLEREGFVADEEGLAEISSGSIFNARYADRKFDIIVLWHVLEHLENQDTLLDHLSGKLNSGGLLVLAVPNFGSWQQKLFGKYWFHLDLPRHLVHIDANWLREGLSQRSYRVLKENHIDILQNIYGFVQSALNTLALSRQNSLYRALKKSEGTSLSSVLTLLAWTLPTTLLFPFAIVELCLSGIFKKGATVQFVAKIEKAHD
jgi:2-polyprenyl-3-methyl-5-hydroxy-6-metoxy-1,4-benzoquinol methylase